MIPVVKDYRTVTIGVTGAGNFLLTTVAKDSLCLAQINLPGNSTTTFYLFSPGNDATDQAICRIDRGASPTVEFFSPIVAAGSAVRMVKGGSGTITGTLYIFEMPESRVV